MSNQPHRTGPDRSPHASAARSPDLSAIVLAGGRAARLGGADKAGIEIGGRTLLARALDAVQDAGEVVVVGDEVPTERPVTFVREEPRYGGPVAALLTGWEALPHPTTFVAVMAVDMPYLTPATLRRLVEAPARDRDVDGAVLVDPDGRRQLALVLATDRLAAVRPDREDQHAMALHRLLASLRLVDVPSEGDEYRDIDTWADLRDA